MHTSFYFITTFFLIAAVFYSTYRKKRLSARNFDFDYAIEEKRYQLSWQTYILFAFLLFLVIDNWFDISFTLFATTTITVLLFEGLKANKPPTHKSYLIRNSKLIYNGWKIKEFDLKDLESIRFLPFRDSFKLVFKNNKSLVLARDFFDRDILSNFIQKAVLLSSEKIDIEEDAKTKIYI